MKKQQVFALIGIAAIALILAFPLRDAVFETVVVPLAYIFWALGLAYRALHQGVWWVLALFLVLLVISRSLLPQAKTEKKIPLKKKPAVGQVENLAGWIAKTKRGTYFKWLIANRLGKIANQILLNRSAGKQRSFFDPITGPDWSPDASVQSYLEAGLHKSFADFPQKNWFFAQPKPTSLDHDMEEVIQYLELQIKQ